MISIVITTFEYRFEKYFKNLIHEIKDINVDVEVIICVNGEHNKKFNDEYRKNMLIFLSEYKNVFPIFFTEFRSLSKLWNTGIIHTTNDNVLVLNDDISIKNNNVLNIIENYINNNVKNFKINSSWSHFLINKKTINDLGWFDERLLGIGEEDGDMEWRFSNKNILFTSINILGIYNYVDMSHNPNNIKCIKKGKYSQFNHNFFYFNKMKIDDVNGVRRGICPAKLIEIDPCILQYPYENFFWKNKNKL